MAINPRSPLMRGYEAAWTRPMAVATTPSTTIRLRVARSASRYLVPQDLAGIAKISQQPSLVA